MPFCLFQDVANLCVNTKLSDNTVSELPSNTMYTFLRGAPSYLKMTLM